MFTQTKNYIIKGNSLNKTMDTYHLILAPTFACNLGCKHCYLPNHNNNSLSYDVINKLIHEWNEIVLRDNKRYGGIIHIKGGEPLIMSNFNQILKDIINLKSLSLMITTNGTLIKENIFNLFEKAFIELDENIIINLSLDGSCSETHDYIRGNGSYNKSIKFLKELNERNIPTHINFVLSRYNSSELEDILDIAEEYNVSQVNLLPFVAKSYGASIQEAVLTPEENYNIIHKLFSKSCSSKKSLLAGTIPDLIIREKENGYRTYECVAGYKGFYYITPDGSVFSCPNLMDKEDCIGNILNTSLNSIHQEKIQSLYKKLHTSENGFCDFSCKGAVKFYQNTGNIKLVKANDKFNSLMNKYLGRYNGEERKAFCFSRNI